MTNVYDGHTVLAFFTSVLYPECPECRVSHNMGFADGIPAVKFLCSSASVSW